MSSNRFSRERKITCVRPVALGVAVSIGVILIIICLTSALFSLLECIINVAVVPVTFLALILGCFIGGYFCAQKIGKRGLICGAVIGAAVSLIIFIAGCFASDFAIGESAILKFALMILSGCCGGYLGGNGRYGRKIR